MVGACVIYIVNLVYILRDIQTGIIIATSYTSILGLRRGEGVPIHITRVLRVSGYSEGFQSKNKLELTQGVRF